MLEVGVLGAVEARRDGMRVDLPAGKTSELLARLACDAGVSVRADVLLEELWAEPAGRNTLQSKVSQLRRALGAKDAVVASTDGYALAVDPAAVDAHRAVELARGSAVARSAGDVAAALEQARQGLTLFRGEVLVEAGDWAAPHRARLEEVRLGLVEDEIAARVDLGAGAELVGELESLVEAYPLREGLWSSLMTALYRAGRQADALAAYGRLRRLLVEELGIEPGVALRSLEQEILQQSPRLESATAVPHVTAPGNLPPLVSSIVGRGDDVASLISASSERRLVTVVGAAGVGKTRVALEVAHHLADPVTAPGGVWLVRLDAVDGSGSLPQLVADTLHVQTGVESLRDRLSGARTILLLDNCEHVVVKAAALARSLLAGVPHLRIVATSQVPLGIEDEHLHQLQPLTQDESVALFTDRARDVRRQLVLDADTAATIEEVCGSLDGLPLAIELAAARVRSLSVRDIARRLEDRFAVLRDPTSQLPERRRALSGAITWSYELLFPDDQRGLWALSGFAGGASLDAVERVLAALDVPASSALDTITRLVDRSLLIADSVENGAVRYRLLDSIRSFSADRLAESGQQSAAAAAHAGWYAETARWCDENVRSERQPECIAVAHAERPNVEVALAWCAANDPLLGARIAIGFGWTWVVLGDGTAGATRVRSALTSDLPVVERVTGLLLAGWLEASAGDVVLAQSDLDEARALAGELSDDVLLADVDRHQAFLSIQQGRPDVVLTSAAAALATYRPLELAWRSAGCLLLAAFGALMLGDTEAATRDATEAVDILTPIGDSWGLVHAQAMLGGIAQAEHRFADAAGALEQAADRSATMGFLGQAALHRAGLARVQQRAGDDRAASSYERAIGDAVACGDGRLAATARLNLARLRRLAGDPETAVGLLEQNERWYDAAGGGDFALLTHCVLCAVNDDVPGLEDVLARSRVEENPEVQLFALDALARLAARSGDADTSSAQLDEADSLAAQLTHVVDEADRADAASARRLLAGRA